MGSRSLDRRTGDELTVDVISAVAETTGDDPLEMTPPLHDVIDPDALRQILQDPARSVQVRFEYQGRVVEVRSDGDITVRGPAATL